MNLRACKVLPQATDMGLKPRHAFGRSPNAWPGRFRNGLGGFGLGRILARALVALRLGLIRTAQRIDSLGHVRGIFGRIRVRMGGSVDVGRRLTLRDRGILKFNLGGPRRGR